MPKPSIQLHGVFLSIFNQGVLLQGPSGSGKSDTALALLSRGHQLIADDVAEFSVDNQHIMGRCPSRLQNLLEIRALGIVDVTQLFGLDAVVLEKALDLVIRLMHPTPIDEMSRRRIEPEFESKMIMGIPIKHLSLPLALCQNVAILVESAVRLALVNTQSTIREQLSIACD